MTDLTELAARIRSYVAPDPRVIDKKMFGGLGFMVNGNMFLAISAKGELMVRLGKNNDAGARNLLGAESVDFEAKRMGGFLTVPAEAIEEDLMLAGWIDLTLGYAAALPPK